MQTSASREGVTGVRDTTIRIALNAPPVEGAANRALVRFLSKELGIAKGRIEIIAGEKSRNKRLCLKKVPKESLQAFFGKWIPNQGGARWDTGGNG